jgi:Flp pilus assembly protein TadG
MVAMNVRRRLQCDRGSQLVEFALIFPLLLLVVMGVADFGIMFQRYEVLTNAAREGARVAALPDYASADVSARVDQYLAGTGVTGYTTSGPTTESVNVGGSCITLKGVTVTYDYQFIALGRLIQIVTRGSTNPLTTKTLTVTSKMRFEGPAGTC